MRRILKKNSTKTERIFYELLKKLKIPFKHRWMVNKREIDFVIGSYAIDIDGHEQDEKKNNELILAGFIPIHFHNNEIKNSIDKVEKIIKKLIIK